MTLNLFGEHTVALHCGVRVCVTNAGVGQCSSRCRRWVVQSLMLLLLLAAVGKMTLLPVLQMLLMILVVVQGA